MKYNKEDVDAMVAATIDEEEERMKEEIMAFQPGMNAKQGKVLIA